MKYNKGNITANYSEAWMKSLSRDEFIERAKGSGLPDADLGKYWDLVNGEQPQAEPAKERTAKEQLESVLNAKTEDEAADAISTVLNEVGIKNTRKKK